MAPSSAACSKQAMARVTFQDRFLCNALTQSKFQGWMPHHSTTHDAAYIKLGLGLGWVFSLYNMDNKESKAEFVMSKIFCFIIFLWAKKRNK